MRSRISSNSTSAATASCIARNIGSASRSRRSPRSADTTERGTTLRFKPSAQIFTNIYFNYDTLAKRLRELSFLNSGVRIELVDERDEKSEVFQYEGGLKAFVQHLNRSKTPVHDTVLWFQSRDGNTQVEVAMQWNDSLSPRACSATPTTFRKRTAARISPAIARR
jgi:DNA gyrase/topoisomerase IV subunit B